MVLEDFNTSLIVQEPSRFPSWACLELTDLMLYSHQARLVMTSWILECVNLRHFYCSFSNNWNFLIELILAIYLQGAIMAVGASKPTVLADADGFFSVKSKMLVSFLI